MNVLSQQQIDSFNENGFLRIPGVFDADEVEWLSDELERLMQEWAIEGPGWRGPWREVYLTAEQDEKTILTAMHDLQFYSEAYQRAVVNETLTGAVADILGPNLELHHSTLHAKAPETGTPFPMHQDHPFYPHEGAAFIDAIVHIDSANDENGCLRFLAGSHKLGPLEHIRGEAGHSLPTDVYKLEDAVSVPADAGDVVLFSYQTVHGSALNSYRPVAAAGPHWLPRPGQHTNRRSVRGPPRRDSPRPETQSRPGRSAVASARGPNGAGLIRERFRETPAS